MSKDNFIVAISPHWSNLDITPSQMCIFVTFFGEFYDACAENEFMIAAYEREANDCCITITNRRHAFTFTVRPVLDRPMIRFRMSQPNRKAGDRRFKSIKLNLRLVDSQGVIKHGIRRILKTLQDISKKSDV